MGDGSNPIYEPKEFTNYYLSLVDDEHEKVIFKPTKDKDEDKSSDVYDVTNSLKKRTLEFKSPTGEGGQTIYHRFEEAAGQSNNLVIDLSNSSLNIVDSYEKVMKFISWNLKIRTGKNKGMQWSFDEVRLITKDGTSLKVSK